MFDYYQLVVTTHTISNNGQNIQPGATGIVTSPRQSGAWVQFDHLDHDVFVSNAALRPSGTDADRFNSAIAPGVRFAPSGYFSNNGGNDAA